MVHEERIFFRSSFFIVCKKKIQFTRQQSAINVVFLTAHDIFFNYETPCPLVVEHTFGPLPPESSVAPVSVFIYAEINKKLVLVLDGQKGHIGDTVWTSMSGDENEHNRTLSEQMGRLRSRRFFDSTSLQTTCYRKRAEITPRQNPNTTRGRNLVRIPWGTAVKVRFTENGLL